MTSITPESYFESLPESRQEPIRRLRLVWLNHLPKGFQEVVANGMLSYVVPHSIYPKGYHVNPKTPLPFIQIASQKNHIAVYHMGLYGNPQLLQWFTEAYTTRGLAKLDMGKGCIRFKNADQIPYDLLQELAGKLTPQQWVTCYENQLQQARRAN